MFPVLALYKSVIAQSAFVHFSLVLGLVVTAISVLTLFLIALLKLAHHLQTRRQTEFKTKWQPVFAEATFQDVPNLPELSSHHFYLFIKTFNSFHKHMHGASGENLNRMVYRLGILPRVVRMLHSRRAQKKLTAIITLGYLREKSVWDELVWILLQTNPLLSFAAALALQNIDTEKAMPFLIPQIVRHTDWPATIVAQMLQNAGPLQITENFAKAVLAAPPQDIPKLIKYFKVLEPSLYNKELRTILGTHKDPEIIAAALGALNEPKDHEVVSLYLKHPVWFVRVQAVRALGRLGMPQHFDSLISAMDDVEWWVRYRAAQALFKIPGIPKQQIDEISQTATQPRVREILHHVVSEGGAYSD